MKERQTAESEAESPSAGAATDDAALTSGATSVGEAADALEEATPTKVEAAPAVDAPAAEPAEAEAAEESPAAQTIKNSETTVEEAVRVEAEADAAEAEGMKERQTAESEAESPSAEATDAGIHGIQVGYSPHPHDSAETHDSSTEVNQSQPGATCNRGDVLYRCDPEVMPGTCHDTKSPQCVRPDLNASDPSISEVDTSGKEICDFRDKDSVGDESVGGDKGVVVPRTAKKAIPTSRVNRIHCATSQSHVLSSSEDNCTDESSIHMEVSTESKRRLRPTPQDGYTMIQYDNGDIYAGYVKRGVRHGPGVYRYTNGDVYDGEWNLGKKHGTGIYTWPMGESYNGCWIKNKQNGPGVFQWPDGGQYVGEWGERIPGNPFPTVRQTKIDVREGLSSLKPTGKKISNDVWRTKEQRVYRSVRSSKNAKVVAWAVPSRPTTAYSQATTVEAFSRPMTASNEFSNALNAVTSSSIPSSRSEISGFSDYTSAQINDLHQGSGLRQSSGLSQFSRSSVSRRILPGQPDEPARAGFHESYICPLPAVACALVLTNMVLDGFR